MPHTGRFWWAKYVPTDHRVHVDTDIGASSGVVPQCQSAVGVKHDGDAVHVAQYAGHVGGRRHRADQPFARCGPVLCWTRQHRASQCCVGHVSIEPVSAVLDTSTQSQSVLCWTRQHRASQCCVGHVQHRASRCCVGHVNIEPVSAVLDTSTQSQSVLCWTRQHRASQCCVGHVQHRAIQCCVGHVNIEPVSAVLDRCNIQPINLILLFVVLLFFSS